LCEGDIEGTKQVFDGLPQALETSAETVTLTLDQAVREIELAEKREAEARDKNWRENFCPHAIILTERIVPSPIFAAAIIGVEKLLRSWLNTCKALSRWAQTRSGVSLRRNGQRTRHLASTAPGGNNAVF
jgi:hypothetical protein